MSLGVFTALLSVVIAAGLLKLYREGRDRDRGDEVSPRSAASVNVSGGFHGAASVVIAAGLLKLYREGRDRDRGDEVSPRSPASVNVSGGFHGAASVVIAAGLLKLYREGRDRDRGDEVSPRSPEHFLAPSLRLSKEGSVIQNAVLFCQARWARFWRCPLLWKSLV